MDENQQQHLGSEQRTTKVWGRNVDEEMARLKECHKRYPLIAFDTEYPGTIHPTNKDSSHDQFYTAMKANVESTKLIQCGFTLFNSKGEIGGSWEINFSNFVYPSDTHNEDSIQFLRKHGLDLDKIRKEGIDMFGYGFFPKLLSMFHTQTEFVTFQGAYDFAYLLCIINNGKLPETREEFVSEVVKVFGEVYDLKVMAGFCEGLGEHLGLSKLAQLLKITRVGRTHHAGSDSLMTALVFIKLKQDFEDSMSAKGMLYGIGKGTTVNATTTTTTLPSPLTTTTHTMPSPLTTTIPRLASPYLVPVMRQQTHPGVFRGGYVPNYRFLFWNPTTNPWMSYNGMYVNQLNHQPSSTFAYPVQTTYYAAGYRGPLRNLLRR